MNGSFIWRSEEFLGASIWIMEWNILLREDFGLSFNTSYPWIKKPLLRNVNFILTDTTFGIFHISSHSFDLKNIISILALFLLMMFSSQIINIISRHLFHRLCGFFKIILSVTILKQPFAYIVYLEMYTDVAKVRPNFTC